MKFRKKPVVIEAFQFPALFDIEGRMAFEGWFLPRGGVGRYVGDRFHIKTLEDGPEGEAKHVADVGDWIIQGIKGEFYPCKPDIFAATYEVAE